MMSETREREKQKKPTADKLSIGSLIFAADFNDFSQ